MTEETKAVIRAPSTTTLGVQFTWTGPWARSALGTAQTARPRATADLVRRRAEGRGWPCFIALGGRSRRTCKKGGRGREGVVARCAHSSGMTVPHFLN